MKRLRGVMLIAVVSTCHADTDQKRFDAFWYDGNAEISVYELNESRYGQTRKGTRIMVFVTEPMRLATHIKPDVKLSPDEMIRVIKLNDKRTFVTGIYDYSVMTSVFSAVEKKPPYDNGSTMKISFTAQEWCGQVFERLVRMPEKYDGVLYSYFESEGETAYSFPAHNTETEDNLWIRVRELNGLFLKEGESISLRLIPSLWNMRKTHSAADVKTALLEKEHPAARETVLGKIPVTVFRWTIDSTSTSVYVEAEYPHRIVEFHERDGSSGKLVASKRYPYWKQNDAAYERLRDELHIGK